MGLYPTGISIVDLQHREAIRNLITRYTYLLSDHDFSGIVELFTEEGRMESIGGVHHGRDAIRGYYANVISGNPQGSDRKHFVTDIWIDLHGDAAKTICQFMAVRQKGDVLVVGSAGRYVDQMILKEGRWWFSHRKVFLDHRGDIGLRPGLSLAQPPW